MSNGSLEDHLLGMPKTVLVSILYIWGNLQENLQESLFQVTIPDSLLYTLLHSPRNSFASNCLTFINFCKSPGKTPKKSSWSNRLIFSWAISTKNTKKVFCNHLCLIFNSINFYRCPRKCPEKFWWRFLISEALPFSDLPPHKKQRLED